MGFNSGFKGLKFYSKLHEEKRGLICARLSHRKFSVPQEIGLVMWSMVVKWQRINQRSYLVSCVTGYLQRWPTALELHLRRTVTVVHTSTPVFVSCIKNDMKPSVTRPWYKMWLDCWRLCAWNVFRRMPIGIYGHICETYSLCDWTDLF